MNGYKDLVKAAFSDFKRSKIRTLLTSLGIMIGVLSVVMLIALGLGLKNYIKNQFESLGANLVMILPGSGLGGQGGFGPGLVGGASFDEKDVRSLQRISGVKYTVPVFFKSSKVESTNKEQYGYIMGVNEDYFSLMNVKTVSGKLFDNSEVQAGAKIAVLGYTLSEKLFSSAEDGVGRTIRFDNQRFKVIGVAEKTGDNEQDTGVIIPYKTTFGSLNPNKTFWAIYLGVESDDDVASVKQQTKDTLLKRYNEDDFSVTEQSELLSTINQIFNILNAVLVAIGSISLLVGGIGIMNIMYASVTERTKEVGIRRAVGATQDDILKQFLTESVLLSALGGVIGLCIAILIVLAVRPFFPLSINVLSVVIALGISSAIGVFFGVFPAKRAAKLPPIEAIRRE
jgi:putative ABC transport system permease protein